MPTNMSSASYVAMQLRDPDNGAERFLNGKVKGVQIPIRSVSNCDHVATICPDKKCVEGWSIDYVVSLDRTIAGRKLKKELNRESTTVQA